MRLAVAGLLPRAAPPRLGSRTQRQVASGSRLQLCIAASPQWLTCDTRQRRWSRGGCTRPGACRYRGVPRRTAGRQQGHAERGRHQRYPHRRRDKGPISPQPQLAALAAGLQAEGGDAMRESHTRGRCAVQLTHDSRRQESLQTRPPRCWRADSGRHCCHCGLPLHRRPRVHVHARHWAHPRADLPSSWFTTGGVLDSLKIAPATRRHWPQTTRRRRQRNLTF